MKICAKHQLICRYQAMPPKIMTDEKICWKVVVSFKIIYCSDRQKIYFFPYIYNGSELDEKNIGNICHAINEWISPFTTTLLKSTEKNTLFFYLLDFLYTTIFCCCQSRKYIYKERHTIQKSIRIQKSSQKWNLWNLSLPKMIITLQRKIG